MSARAVRVFRWGWFGRGGRRRSQPVDRVLAWWLWNFASGARLGAGPAISGDRGLPGRLGRGAGRLLVTAVVVVLVYVQRGAPAGAAPTTLAAVGLGGTAAAGVALLAGTWMVVVWWHRRRWVKPLHLALFGPAGWPEDKRPGSYLRVPRTFADGKHGVIVSLPPTFAGRPTERLVVAQVVRDKLALGDVSDNWVLRGKHAYLQLRPRQRPPERAPFADPTVRVLVERAKPSAPVIGLTHGGRAVAVDLDDESPHVLLSAGTGGGKSSTIRAIAAQLMRPGATCWVIDAKRHSHAWLRDVPGVRYFRDIEEIHHALVALGAEGQRRNRAFDHVGIDDPAPVFPRLVVICEELNATMRMLKQWWSNNRERGDQPGSPAVEALGQVVFMGRAVRIHVLAVAQMASAKDMGGGEQRENYAVRILARYTANAWRMLVPECTFAPSTRHPGRAQVCIGGTATETQVLFMTPHEARDWVMGGAPRPAADVAVSHVAAEPDSLGEPPATVAATPTLTVVRDIDRPAAVTLAEASSDRGRGVVALKFDALRQAARRDPEFPPAVAQRRQARVYEPEALVRWERNRPGTKGQAL